MSQADRMFLAIKTYHQRGVINMMQDIFLSVYERLKDKKSQALFGLPQQTKAEITITIIGVAGDAKGRAGVFGEKIPAAAPYHPERAR